MRLFPNNTTRRYLATLLALSVVATAADAVAVDLIGYVPYYRMSTSYNTNTLPAQLAMLDEVRYFGLTAASNGAIVPLENTMSYHTNNINTLKNAIAALPAEDRPRLNITLGGAGQAASFATIAPSSSLRATFAQNINALLNSTGATSVDIDWEHPAPGNERLIHYPAMLKRIKQEIGVDRRVSATLDPTVMIPNSVFNSPNAIDGISLMTYDLGWWGNDPNNPYQGEHSLPEYVADSVEAWTEPFGSPNDRNWVFGTWGNNVPAGKLGVGLPFYSHSVTSPDATQIFSDLVSGGTTSDGNYYTYQGRSYWLPGPSLAAQRVQYAHEQGLNHIIIWELGQDVHPDSMHPDPNKRSLLRAAYDAKLALEPVPGDYDGDRDVDIDDFNLWRSTFGSVTDLRADGNGDLVVNAGDYVIWRKHSAPGGGSSAPASVPEPRAAYLILFAAVLRFVRRTQGSNRS
jgi:GH18 family chitinase